MKEIFVIDAINHIDYDLVEEYAKEKECLKNKQASKRNRHWLKSASMAACFCIMIAVTVATVCQIQNLPRGLGITPGTGIIVPETENEDHGNNDHKTDDPPNTNSDITDVEFNDTDNALIEYSGKSITLSLWNQLQSSSADKQLNIYLDARIYVQDQSFLYQGKTLQWYSDNADKNDALIDKLSTLPKIGDALKYGEILYTTGTPTGEKWGKELYDETVAYYGKELLEKYIVDNEFLLTKVLEDADKAIADADAARREYVKACSEYKKFKLAKAYKMLDDKGIIAGLSKTGNTLMITVTKAEFEALDFENIHEWRFTVFISDDVDMNSNGDLLIPDDDADQNTNT